MLKFIIRLLLALLAERLKDRIDPKRRLAQPRRYVLVHDPVQFYWAPLGTGLPRRTLESEGIKEFPEPWRRIA